MIQYASLPVYLYDKLFIIIFKKNNIFTHQFSNPLYYDVPNLCLDDLYNIKNFLHNYIIMLYTETDHTRAM